MEKKKKKIYDSQRKAKAKYDRANTKQFMMKLNLNTDQDILSWLSEQENKQGKIKELIRQEIKKEK